MISPSHQQVRGKIQMHASPPPEVGTVYQHGISLRQSIHPSLCPLQNQGVTMLERFWVTLTFFGTQSHLNWALLPHFISHLIITQLHNVIILTFVYAEHSQSNE